MQMPGNKFVKLLIAGAVVAAVVTGILFLSPMLAYRSYAERAHRTEALNAMGRLVTAQEQFRLRNRTYTNDPPALGFEGSCSENCVYLASIELMPDAQAYIARFVPNPAGGTNGVNQSGDKDCQLFTINSFGARAAANRKCLDGR